MRIMNKIDKLITEKCPKGVKKVKLKDLTRKVYNIKWDGECRKYIDLSSVDIEQHCVKDSDITIVTKETAPSRAKQLLECGDILFGGTRPMQKRICLLGEEYDGCIGSTGFNVIRIDKSLVDNRYVYHCMNTTEFYDYVERTQHGASYPAISDAETKEYEIPLPPIEIQREIVSILDKFTELEKKLTEELELRKKQYQYYLDCLFENSTAEKAPLSEVGNLQRGKRFVHADAVDEGGVPCIHYGELYTYYSVYTNYARSMIREELRKKMRYAHRGDVIIVGAGENNIDIGVGVVWDNDDEVAVHDACYTFSHKQNPKYISYFLRSTDYHNQIKKYVSEGKICSISAEGIGRAMIPIPSLDEQNRIVAFLDTFEEICNDSEVGLLAEIKLRHAQYEYYRDKILSFNRKEA